jgi:hypothetical protein
MDENKLANIAIDLVNKNIKKSNKNKSKQELDKILDDLEEKLLIIIEETDEILDLLIKEETMGITIDLVDKNIKKSNKDTLEKYNNMILSLCKKIFEIAHLDVAVYGWAYSEYISSFIYSNEKEKYLISAKDKIKLLTKKKGPNQKFYWGLRMNIALASGDKKELKKCKKILD